MAEVPRLADRMHADSGQADLAKQPSSIPSSREFPGGAAIGANPVGPVAEVIEAPKAGEMGTGTFMAVFARNGDWHIYGSRLGNSGKEAAFACDSLDACDTLAVARLATALRRGIRASFRVVLVARNGDWHIYGSLRVAANEVGQHLVNRWRASSMKPAVNSTIASLGTKSLIICRAFAEAIFARASRSIADASLSRL